MGILTLDNVSKSFGEGAARTDVLKDITLDVKEGVFLVLLGFSGTGKTTLIKLLLRLYDVQAGGIELEGVDLRQLDLTDIRRSMGLVSQEVYLFHGSIAENIRYGSEMASMEQLRAAARQAQLDEFVQTLPAGYETIVGERGIKLSGGQRQRLSIARAILKDAPILLLDEATSAVDTETERAIQENLRQLTHGKTAVIIAHRLSTIRHADRIVVLSEGRVAEIGSHDELLVQDGIYADLWRVQIGETTEGL